MTVKSFYISKYDWYVTVYYDTTCADVKKILFHLNLLDCDESTKIKIRKSINTCQLNTGLTYTNYELRQSLIVISETSSFDEFLNTITHENMHLSIHIMECFDIDLTGEEPCYLMGYVTQAQSDVIKKHICNR